jgi:hypothetical protein
MPEQCRYFNICGLPFFVRHENADYCILHYPTNNKDRNAFSFGLQSYLKTGKSDFRYVHFPQSMANFNNRTFASLPDFTGAVFNGGLAMEKTHLSCGLTLDTENISGINLSGAIIEERTVPYDFLTRSGHKEVNFDLACSAAS